MNFEEIEKIEKSSKIGNYFMKNAVYAETKLFFQKPFLGDMRIDPVIINFVNLLAQRT